MKVNKLIEELELTVLTEGDLERECEGCYCGDLLSWVMSRAKDGDIWLTVMGNVNAVACIGQGTIIMGGMISMVDNINRILDRVALYLA